MTFSGCYLLVTFLATPRSPSAWSPLFCLLAQPGSSGQKAPIFVLVTGWWGMGSSGQIPLQTLVNTLSVHPNLRIVAEILPPDWKGGSGKPLGWTTPWIERRVYWEWTTKATSWGGGRGGREKQNGRKASRFYDSSGVVFEVHCSQLDVLSGVVDLLGMGLREITGKEKVP